MNTWPSVTTLSGRVVIFISANDVSGVGAPLLWGPPASPISLRVLLTASKSETLGVPLSMAGEPVTSSKRLIEESRTVGLV